VSYERPLVADPIGWRQALRTTETFILPTVTWIVTHRSPPSCGVNILVTLVARLT